MITCLARSLWANRIESWFEESLVPERVDDDLRCRGEPSENKAPNEQRVVDVQDWE